MRLPKAGKKEGTNEATAKEVPIDRGHEAGAQEAHEVGGDTGEGHPSTLTTTIVNPPSPFLHEVSHILPIPVAPTLPRPTTMLGTSQIDRSSLSLGREPDFQPIEK